MSKKVEKSFEQRLRSLKNGCIIFGILELLALIFNIYSLLKNGIISSLIGVIIAALLLAIIYYMYKYTKEKNPKGPKYEKIFGILMLIEGILSCLTIAGLLIGFIFIILAFGILSEANYFKEYINGNISEISDIDKE